MGDVRNCYCGDDENDPRERENRVHYRNTLYALFRVHFTPGRNVQHSTADFLNLRREDRETVADVWKHNLEGGKEMRNWDTNRS